MPLVACSGNAMLLCHRGPGALIGCVASAWIMYKGGSFATSSALVTASIILLMIEAFAPIVLLPVWRSWMLFANYLGIVMSTIIVSIAWTIMLVPIAITLKIIGKKVMDLYFDRSVATYWEDREEKYHDLREAGIDPLLSQHIAHIFVRDPLVIFDGAVEEVNDETQTEHFESIQSTNW